MENQSTNDTVPTPPKKNNLVIGLLIIVILFAFVLGGLIVFILLHRTSSSPSETITPTPTQTATQTPTVTSVQTNSSYCLPANLSSTLSLSPGAGNVYGTFKMTNVSKKSCQVLGTNFVQVTYDTTTIKNITVSHQGTNNTGVYTLQPNQTLYSQVHYPNGPQCSAQTVQDPVTFTYKVSNTDSVTFKDSTGKQSFIVNGCSSPTETTDITIWNISDQPITP